MTPITDRPVLALLRLEGAAAFAAGLAGYLALSDGWITLALFALAPDLAMIGYAAGPKVGARLYNLAHSYLAPALLGALGVALAPALLPIACVWFAHIGIDRALGYGLKSETSFGLTHLGRIGRAA
jgi:hypothetical protein